MRKPRRARRLKRKYDMRDFILCQDPLHIDPELHSGDCPDPWNDMIPIDPALQGATTLGTSQGWTCKPISINVTHHVTVADVGITEPRELFLYYLWEALCVVPFVMATGPADLALQTPAFVPILTRSQGPTEREGYDVLWRRISAVFGWQETLEDASGGVMGEHMLHPVVSQYLSPMHSARRLDERKGLFYVRNAIRFPYGQNDGNTNTQTDLVSNVWLRYGASERPK